MCIMITCENILKKGHCRAKKHRGKSSESSILHKFLYNIIVWRRQAPLTLQD